MICNTLYTYPLVFEHQSVIDHYDAQIHYCYRLLLLLLFTISTGKVSSLSFIYSHHVSHD